LFVNDIQAEGVKARMGPVPWSLVSRTPSAVEVLARQSRGQRQGTNRLRALQQSWMSNLDKAMKPILTAPILGRNAVFDAKQQLLWSGQA
jgi:hypothetical protein